jgi:hypothetical protein
VGNCGQRPSSEVGRVQNIGATAWKSVWGGIAKIDLGLAQLSLRSGDLRRKSVFRGKRGIDGRLVAGRCLQQGLRAPKRHLGIAISNEHLIYEQLFAELNRFYQRKEGAWRAFKGSHKEWPRLGGKQPKGFRFGNRASGWQRGDCTKLALLHWVFAGSNQ